MNVPNSPQEEAAVHALYKKLLDAWNTRNASAFAGLMAETANIVGFDGSPLNGLAEIEGELQRIFADHRTAAYVSKVREIRFLSADVALLRAVVGMVPDGKNELNPEVNAIQSLVAVRQDDQWRIALFQNTPAQFHGRAQKVIELTEELTQVLKQTS